jgi:hypothetical protein
MIRPAPCFPVFSLTKSRPALYKISHNQPVVIIRTSPAQARFLLTPPAAARGFARRPGIVRVTWHCDCFAKNLGKAFNCLNAKMFGRFQINPAYS